MAAVCGSLLARAFFGPAGNLAAAMPKPGQSWQAAGSEAIITSGLVLMVLNPANGPEPNGPFVPLAGQGPGGQSRRGERPSTAASKPRLRAAGVAETVTGKRPPHRLA